MSAEFKDYYATLGISREASQDDIKKAFRKLARKHHPDVAKDRPGSEAKFKEINEANEVLSDPEKAQMTKVKDMGLEFHDLLTSLGANREISLAKTKVEEAVMWAVKAITS